VPSLQSMRVKPLRGKALIHRLAFASLGFFTTSLAFADAIHEPLWVENLSPLASLLALPSQRSADIREGLSVTFHSDIATHFVSQARSGELVFFDGETQRHSLGLRWGILPDWELSAVVPFTRHSGGFTDGYVNRWHDFFGMPDGGRNDVPEDQLRYQFASPQLESTLFESASGLGDVTLELAFMGERQRDLQIAYAVGYKASTGDSSDWTGSGSSDLYGVARFSGAHRSELPLYWHGQLGITSVGNSSPLGPEQRDWIWFGGLSAEWHFNQRWALIGQIDSHSAILDSSLDALGEPAAMLSLGLRRQLNSKWAIDVSFAEDIVVESAPDIIFQASVHYRP
jgi:hypothetical protein